MMTMTRRQPLRMLLLLLVAHQAYSVIMQHSFMGPYHPNGIPFWKHGAGANINESYVRLTPARQSRTGFHWNVIPSKMTDWQVEFDFKIEGAKMLGGDGFAFWYTSTPEVLGMVYGAADYWKGLGIFFDTYDNDAAGQTPLISAVVNDGTIKYDSASDGATQALGKCSYQIRNQDKVSRAKVKYEDETLSLSIAIDRDKDYEPCLRVSGVKLGTDKYFGLSAHTGDVADSHDIYQFSVTDLTAKDQDLDNVRNEYNKFIQSEQDKHQSLDMNQFRHEVMTMLHQIQDSLTVLESTSLSQAQSNSGSDSPLARDMSTMVQKMGGRIYDIQSVQHNTKTKHTHTENVHTKHTLNSRGELRWGVCCFERFVVVADVLVWYGGMVDGMVLWCYGAMEWYGPDILFRCSLNSTTGLQWSQTSSLRKSTTSKAFSSQLRTAAESHPGRETGEIPRY
mmetsp:Transcript_25663/g.45560  ORF Transcript_25663/g.45560 Transcript_25663/m.45560 type:complete len:450 (+) Transcript_25663:33-1382(+)